MVVKRVAILFSGSGTNMQNLFEKIHNKTFGNTKIEIVLTITNNKHARGIERSKKYDISPILIENEKFKIREEFDKKLVEIIKKHNIDLAVLAGFMRILTPIFTNNILAINVHPSLLPMFKGAHAIKESFLSEETKGGASVHFVNEELDGGEIIVQKCFNRTKNMNFEEFEKSIHDIEYEILPQAVVQVLTKNKSTQEI